ncbi:MAG: hypothetical protein QOH90_827 [Actinomycetota bacterium]|nr:hypothetical protein [Actinomycetota bacterium]
MSRARATTAPSREANLAGIGLALMSAAAFGTLAILAKLGYDRGADPIPLLAGRFAVAGALLLAFHVAIRRPLVPSVGVVARLLLLGGFVYGGEATLFFVALTKAPAGIVSLIFFSYPLMTNVLGFATGLERPSARVIVALALGSAGILSIFSITGADRAGLLLALLAALAVAIYFLAAQVIMRGIHPTVSATWTSLGAAVVLGVASSVSRQSLPLEAMPSAATLGVATVIAFVALYAAIGKIGSSRASVAQMLEPVVTVLLGALILSERLTWRIGLGAALIVSSLPLLTATGHQEEIPPPPDSL